MWFGVIIEDEFMAKSRSHQKIYYDLLDKIEDYIKTIGDVLVGSSVWQQGFIDALRVAPKKMVRDSSGKPVDAYQNKPSPDFPWQSPISSDDRNAVDCEVCPRPHMLSSPSTMQLWGYPYMPRTFERSCDDDEQEETINKTYICAVQLLLCRDHARLTQCSVGGQCRNRAQLYHSLYHYAAWAYWEVVWKVRKNRSLYRAQYDKKEDAVQAMIDAWRSQVDDTFDGVSRWAVLKLREGLTVFCSSSARSGLCTRRQRGAMPSEMSWESGTSDFQRQESNRKGESRVVAPGWRSYGPGPQRVVVLAEPVHLAVVRDEQSWGALDADVNVGHLALGLEVGLADLFANLDEVSALLEDVDGHAESLGECLDLWLPTPLGRALDLVAVVLVLRHRHEAVVCAVVLQEGNELVRVGAHVPSSSTPCALVVVSRRAHGTPEVELVCDGAVEAVAVGLDLLEQDAQLLAAEVNRTTLLLDRLVVGCLDLCLRLLSLLLHRALLSQLWRPVSARIAVRCSGKRLTLRACCLLGLRSR